MYSEAFSVEQNYQWMQEQKGSKESNTDKKVHYFQYQSDFIGSYYCSGRRRTVASKASTQMQNSAVSKFLCIYKNAKNRLLQNG